MANSFGIFRSGHNGFTMNNAFYLPFGGSGETLLSSTTSQVVVRVASSNETYTFAGAFNGASSFGSIAGTINSIVVNTAANQLDWQVTSTNMPFGPASQTGSYLSFANAQNYFGFEFEAIGTSGQLFGDAGNDGFVGFTGNHIIDGGGGTDTLDYRSIDVAGRSLLIDVAAGTVQKGYVFNGFTTSVAFGTDQVSNVEVFLGSNTNSNPSANGGTTFSTGPGNHRFVGASASNIANGFLFNGAGPAVLDLSTNTIPLNGYGGADSFSGITSFSFVGNPPSTETVIAGPGSHDIEIDRTGSLTLDFSHAPHGVTLRPGDLWFVFDDNGYGGSDRYGNGVPTAGISLTVKPGPGQNSVSLANTVDYSGQPSGIIGNLASNLGTGVVHNGYGSTDDVGLAVNLIGTSFSDTLTGDPSNNALSGGDGNDTLTGAGGNDTLDGGRGVDTAVFSGARASYSITTVATGTQVSGPDGTDILRNIEFLRFSDVTIATPGNRPPVLTSNGGGDNASLSIAENTTAVTTVTATDPDAGTTLEFAIVGGVDAGSFQINASSGALSFVSAPDFEHPTDSDHNNSYVVQVRASDGSLSDDQTITVNVTDVPETTHWMASVNIGAHPAGWLPSGFGDVNADGTSDVFWYNASTGGAESWKIQSGQWAGSVGLGIHPAGYNLAGNGDFNHDGMSDVLWFNPTNNATDIWLLNNGQWAGSTTLGAHPAGYLAAGVGDFNHDGTSDVLWFNPTTNQTDIWRVNNGQWAGSTSLGAHPAGYQVVGIGDFNHDGTSDVLWFNPSTGQTDIWLVNNGQWAGSTSIGAHPAGWVPIGTGDFNQDGTSDVVWYNAANNDAEVWLVKNGQWAGSVDLGTHPLGSQLMGVGDFDHNGVSDVMWRDTSNGSIETWLLAYS
jgi:hypothetical protein